MNSALITISNHFNIENQIISNQKHPKKYACNENKINDDEKKAFATHV